MYDEALLKLATEIAIATVSNAGEKSAFLVNNPEAVAEYIEVVYKKLKEINDTILSN